MNKPKLRFWQIWNMSFGFLGIQFGFGLQNANVSRIFQTLGADVERIPLLWIAAPVTGLIMQPIIGYLSDHTWGKFGRRRPFFMVGAILASLALLVMPNSPSLWIAAGMLWIMDASINISMEPFRALVADKLPVEQHTLGFSVQTLLIGIGAVVGSWLPYILGNWIGISKQAGDGLVADNVAYSFYFGAFVLLATILWTVFTTSEYPPKELAQGAEEEKPHKFFIPRIMVKLLLVQFFSWFALFSMWVYTTPAVALKFYGTADPNTQAFRDAGDWVGILFGVYNGVSAIIALTLPLVARRLSKKVTHSIALGIGGLSLLSFLLFSDPHFLIIPMIGIGIAWGSILAMPYAMLASSIPPKRMGVYMGLFNMSITIPQIVSGIFSGLILKYFFADNPILCIVMAGIFMFLGAVSALFIKEKHV
jgi:maltose/moltooligosaccharide transporter